MAGRAICRRPPAPAAPLSWARSFMPRALLTRPRCCGLMLLLALAVLAGCGAKPDPHTVTMLIESSPSSLDPRVGVDAQSEHIDSLIFDSLVRKDAHFNLRPWLATSWE